MASFTSHIFRLKNSFPIIYSYIQNTCKYPNYKCKQQRVFNYKLLQLLQVCEKIYSKPSKNTSTQKYSLSSEQVGQKVREIS